MIELINGECIESMRRMPDDSVDAVITDPPYGMGIDTWDKKIDVAAFTSEAKRISSGFYTFFGQMPYIREWDAEAIRHGFVFMEHIEWIKRHQTPSCRLSKTHETLYIYRSGSRKKFHKTRGPYSDVKVPGVMFDVVSIEAIKRHISELHTYGSGGERINKKGTPARNPIYSRFKSSRLRAPANVNFTNVWSFQPPNKASLGKGARLLHPTRKPTEIMTRLVEMLTPAGGTVIDPFIGSGTTAVACIRTGRNCIGIERDSDICETARARIAAEDTAL